MESEAKPERFNFDMQGLLAAFAVFGAALAMLQWSTKLLGSLVPIGVLVCPFSCLGLSSLLGSAIERGQGGRGLKGGAWGGALPLLLTLPFAEGVDLDFSLQQIVLFVCYWAVAGAFVGGALSLMRDGAPRDLSWFFYWNWRSLFPIAAIALILFAWSQWVAPYRAVTVGGLKGEVRNERGKPSYHLNYVQETLLIRADRTVESGLSATRYYSRAFVVVGLGLLSLWVLHAMQSPPDRLNEFSCPPTSGAG